MTTLSERRRSVGFLEHEGETWACFLGTHPDPAGVWHGYLCFRPSHGGIDGDDVRTTEIFIEASEAEIHEKARGMGRPLLRGLLESALYTSARRGTSPEDRLRGRFRSLLVENASEIAGDWSGDGSGGEMDADRLRSLYASYRLDQVAHLICLVEPEAFDAAVDRILEGESIDFLSKDRMQFAMMVVDHVERMLPLPDFETWARDYRANPEAYRLYAHVLHREGRLP